MNTTDESKKSVIKKNIDKSKRMSLKKIATIGVGGLTTTLTASFAAPLLANTSSTLGTVYLVREKQNLLYCTTGQ